MPHSFIQTLPQKALDIIGDVHGELDALETLLNHLGYDAYGNHPEHRHLVFVGDVCDRGNNSPGVLRKLQFLVEEEKASAIIGNHELNLLLNDPKDGSGWFFKERQERDNAFYAPYQQATHIEKPIFFDFLKTLPLALERDDIRIVHACWDEPSIQKIRESTHSDLLTAYSYWEEATTLVATQTNLEENYQKTLLQWQEALENPDTQPPFLQTIADYELLERLHNPIKVLTSGLEQQAEKPFFIGNKWRFTDRTRWWDDYQDATPVVIGHYWRSLIRHSGLSRYSQLFENTKHNEWHGLKKNVFCVDYSIGASWRSRHREIRAPSHFFYLAALRWPENELMLNTGVKISLS